MVQKKEIRKQVFALRKSCSDAEISENSLEITRRILDMPAFRRAKRILAYMDYNHEVETRYLIEEAWKQGKEVAVPRVMGEEMNFYRIHDFSGLKKSSYGIPEPGDNCEEVHWDEALMIMPGVAFDRQTNRIGYGGGFYDRYLEKHPHIERLAVAFSFQIFEKVPTEETDICPQLIVTEKEVIYHKEAC